MPFAPLLALSTLGIVVIVVAAVVVLFFIGGLLGVRARARHQEREFAKNVADADKALEQARALDRGWDRAPMEEAARAAIAQARPGEDFHQLHLVLVDDKPGTEQDRAHFVAVGPDWEARVVLSRHGDAWVADQVD
jgi:hypothetical protein